MSDPVIKGTKRSAHTAVPHSAGLKHTVKRRTSITNTAQHKSPVTPADKRPTRAVAVHAKPVKQANVTSNSKTNKRQQSRGTKVGRSKADGSAANGAGRSSSGASSKSSGVKPQKRLSKHAATNVKTVLVSSGDRAKSALQTISAKQIESNALQSFEQARQEFAQGNFSKARALFHRLIAQHADVIEIAARARTYLAVAEARLNTPSAKLPDDADELYDYGVVALNRGQFAAAEQMFERALKRQPAAAHVHYGLAAAQSRLGILAAALASLEQALTLQPNLRLRASHDQDLAALRNNPDFERLVS